MTGETATSPAPADVSGPAAARIRRTASGRGDALGGLALAWRLARRELRGGLAGFRILIGCLLLGVASIAAVGSVAAALQTSLRADARILLGGDVELRLAETEMTPEQRAAIGRVGRVSELVAMRSMVRRLDNNARSLIELKAVDGAYPLYGAIEVEPPQGLSAALSLRDGTYGALVAPAILERLGLKTGDRLRLGSGQVQIRGTIQREPDSGGDPFTLGPRMLVSRAALSATGLLQPGTLASYVYRLRLPPGSDVDAWRGQLEADFPDAGWRVRTYENAAPSVQSFIDHTALYLTLVGLTALLVGGVGVGNASATYLAGKARTIATLKSLGAPASLIFRMYFVQVMALAAVGIVLGVVLGAAAPFLCAALVGDRLPVPLRPGPYALPLMVAASYGMLVAMLFAIWPLARARDIPPTALFRGALGTLAGRPRGPYLIAMGLCGLALAAIAVATAAERGVALWFMVAAVIAVLVFRLAADLVSSAARRAGHVRAPTLRLGLANLYRPGAPTSTVVLSLGLGLTVLVVIVSMQANLDLQLLERIPARAPAYFLIDIQPDEAQAFAATVTAIPGVSGLERVPSLRGRISRIKGVPVDKAVVAPEAQWAVRGDRGFTYASTVPRGSTVVAGSWWPADYHGKPLVSFDTDLAKGMGVAVGDQMTFSILGREITATVGNLRRINWTDVGINFTTVFAPGTLEAAPHTEIATVEAPPSAEQPLERAVSDRFPNVTLINVRDALATAADLLRSLGTVLRITAGVTVAAGILVLIGAVAAGQRRRRYDTVVLKVLGATRGTISKIFLIEYGLLGLVTALIGVGLGSLASWIVLTQVMKTPWHFAAGSILPVALGSVIATLALGFVGTWAALGAKAAALLRDE